VQSNLNVTGLLMKFHYTRDTFAKSLVKCVSIYFHFCGAQCIPTRISMYAHFELFFSPTSYSSFLRGKRTMLPVYGFSFWNNKLELLDFSIDTSGRPYFQSFSRLPFFSEIRIASLLIIIISLWTKNGAFYWTVTIFIVI